MYFIDSSLYTNSKLFLQDTFFSDNIERVWIPEIQKYSKKLVLVATKEDLRSDTATLESLSQKKESIVTQEDGLKVMKKIKAGAYQECSAVTHEGVDEVFQKVVSVALAEPEERSSSQCCTLI